MLNVQNTAESSVNLVNLNTANKNTTVVAKAQPQAQSSSTVVQLQGKNQTEVKNSNFKVDSNNAASLAADLASFLSSGRGVSSQANMSGFDAARLLA